MLSDKLIKSMQGFDQDGRRLPQDAVVCNCSVCEDVIIVGESRRRARRRVQHIFGRPICDGCADWSPKTRYQPSNNSPGRSDRNYHGGLFNRGEW